MYNANAYSCASISVHSINNLHLIQQTHAHPALCKCPCLTDIPRIRVCRPTPPYMLAKLQRCKNAHAARAHTKPVHTTIATRWRARTPPPALPTQHVRTGCTTSMKKGRPRLSSSVSPRHTFRRRACTFTTPHPCLSTSPGTARVGPSFRQLPTSSPAAPAPVRPRTCSTRCAFACSRPRAA